MKYDTIITNGTIQNTRQSYKADVLIKDGCIAGIIQTGSYSGKVQNHIDASGLILCPGGIDSHVHLEMPIGDYCSSDDFYDGSCAAALGGTTSIIDFVEPLEDESLLNALEKRTTQAREKSIVDYNFHMTIGPDQLNRLSELSAVKEAGCSSIKVYTAYDMALKDDQLYSSFVEARKAGLLPVVHAENWEIISSLSEEFISQGKTQPCFHPDSRPESMEAEAIERIIEIAHLAGSPIHIFHISTPLGVDKIIQARAKGRRVTGETCPQYLFLNRKVYEAEGVAGSLPICSPPIRSEEARLGLWKHLEQGNITTISTDHCPFTEEEKKAGMAQFNTTPGGVPSIQMRYAALYSHGVNTGKITPEQWVDICSAGPAKLFGLNQKGEISVTKDADIAFFDPQKEWTIRAENLAETTGWTPYEGLKLKGCFTLTMSRGEVICRDGKVVSEKGRGELLRN